MNSRQYLIDSYEYVLYAGDSHLRMEKCNETGNKDLNTTIDQDFYDTFLLESRFWIQRVLLPMVVIFGVVGNAITVVVMTRRRMRSSTSTYLTALAVSDLLYLIFVFTMSLEHYPNSNSIEFYYYWMYNRFGLWLADATACISTWLTVTFTVERYIAVCHPMRGKMLCTESRARIVIILVYFLCFLATVTTPFEWQHYACIRVSDSVTKVYVGKRQTALGQDITYTTAFYWFWCVTFVVLPLILLGVFNCFLIHAVHKSKKRRRQMTQIDQPFNTQTQENKITITLIAVVILFMILQTPTAFLLILGDIKRPKPNSDMDKLFRAFGNICNFLVTINAAANFVLYCKFSARYRRTLLATFLGRCYRLSSPAHSSVNTSEFSQFSRGTIRSTLRERASREGHNSTRYPSISTPKNGMFNRQASLYVARQNDEMYK